MLLLVFGTIIFLFPLSLYLLFLAGLNSRRQPTVLAGPWDFAALLLGLAGFLIFAGPAMLTGFYKNWRGFWTRGDLAALLSNELQADTLWIVGFFGYFGVVVGGAALTCWIRRGTVAVYNVDGKQFVGALVAVLKRLDLRWHEAGNRVFIGQNDSTNKPPDVGAAELLPPVDHTGWPLVLAYDPFPALRHLTYRWTRGRERPFHADIEAELLKELQGVDNEPSGVGVWLSTIAVSLFFWTLFGVVLISVSLFSRSR